MMMIHTMMLKTHPLWRHTFVSPNFDGQTCGPSSKREVSGWFGQASDSRVRKVWPRLRGVQIVARKERWSILARNRAPFRAGMNEGKMAVWL